MTVASDRAETQSRDIPAALNLLLVAFYALLQLFQFVMLPLWLLPSDSRWSLALIAVALLTNSYWSLIHEAIHDLLHPKRAVNAGIGRLLSVMFGSPFQIVRSSHLLHHKLNRAPIEGTEYYQPGKKSFLAAATGYYFQILFGLYFVELVSPLIFFLPSALVRRFKERFVKPASVGGILMQHWTQEPVLNEIRADGALIVLWFGLSFYCYGSDWPLLILVLAARGFLISFLDNVYHYRTPINDIFYANNLWLPKLFQGALLNFNFHGIHHRNPSMPWSQLPVAFRKQRQVFHGNYFIAAARQLAGPVPLQNLPRAR